MLIQDQQVCFMKFPPSYFLHKAIFKMYVICTQNNPMSSLFDEIRFVHSCVHSQRMDNACFCDRSPRELNCRWIRINLMMWFCIDGLEYLHTDAQRNGVKPKDMLLRLSTQHVAITEITFVTSGGDTEQMQ